MEFGWTTLFGRFGAGKVGNFKSVANSMAKTQGDDLLKVVKNARVAKRYRAANYAWNYARKGVGGSSTEALEETLIYVTGEAGASTITGREANFDHWKETAIQGGMLGFSTQTTAAFNNVVKTEIGIHKYKDQYKSLKAKLDSIRKNF